MLSKGRIDGILEYWPTMISAYQPEQLNNFKRHELSEAQNFIFGHLVCSKSQIGAAVIALFDQTMRRSEYFEEIVVQHKLSMPVEEFSAIENALTDIYKESPK
ncbi:hypothetical protein HII17_08945 [Thalassotalea sp. M1531]|uniref:Uncharacterized protein n=1 Tax=Thalassotalea algicola TaxID=2716224 RepID=A0A7Y0LCB1_9GAMM|nr:hypothetical protein [Thalassotalea algicola]NMP31687.1 hypothetical protein [Thalassotalea algicola]